MQSLSTEQKELIRRFCDSVTQRVPGVRIKYATLSIAMRRTSIALILEKSRNRSGLDDRLFEACAGALETFLQSDILITATPEEDDDLPPNELQLIDLGFLPSHYYVNSGKRTAKNNPQLLQNTLLCTILAVLLIGGVLIVHRFEKQEKNFEQMNKRVESSSQKLESFIDDYNERRKKAMAPPPVLIEKNIVSEMRIESPEHREYEARLNKVRADLNQPGESKVLPAMNELDAAIIELSAYIRNEAKQKKGVQLATSLRDALVVVYNKSTGKKFIMPTEKDLLALSNKIDRKKLRRKIDSHVRVVIVNLEVPGWSRNMNISPEVGSSLGQELRELNDLFSEGL